MNKIKDFPYYVTATDKFMSGWGKAKGKIAKLVVCCSNREQFNRVYKNMKKDRTLSFVKQAVNKPHWGKDAVVIVKVAGDCPLWNKD